MKLPEIIGLIDRRILINYTVDLEVLESLLPAPFRPQEFRGRGIAGICLIRLKKSRPKGFPALIGINSENAAHRFAVEWDGESGRESGVFIPRRDTSLWMNSILGGRAFPGVYHHAKFNISEENQSYSLSFKSKDETSLSIHAAESANFPEKSIFHSLSEASIFFEKGSSGYSPSKSEGEYDGLKLVTRKWEVSPLEVSHVSSSYLDDRNIFPKGSVQFDHALLMRGVDHSWLSTRPMCCS